MPFTNSPVDFSGFIRENFGPITSCLKTNITSWVTIVEQFHGQQVISGPSNVYKIEGKAIFIYSHGIETSPVFHESERYFDRSINALVEIHDLTQSRQERQKNFLTLIYQLCDPGVFARWYSFLKLIDINFLAVSG